MPSIRPKDVAEAIVNMFGPKASDLDTERANYTKQVQVRALLALVDDIPRELITLPFWELLEFEQCRAALATILPSWNMGETRALPPVNGKDPVERLRRLLIVCPDELPRPESELPFITNDDFRLDTEAKVRAAWTDFKASEWLGATVFAGCALEALLLWEVKRAKAVAPEVADKSSDRVPGRGVAGWGPFPVPVWAGLVR